MTNTSSTSSVDTRRRQIRTARVLFAGAAAIATLALFGVAQSANAEAAAGSFAPQAQTAPSTGGGGRVVSVDDNNNPSSGDIFTQNAQDQSTASGAGT